ncbi:MAG: LacI family DNA-binding transcriptional regulator [candidate division NC10 bacterium]|nr:LacI family DNA-binding transcriptional regulator [candidate division NC10 bacterium]
MATLHDVAHLAGVSTATVSATINGTAIVSPALQEKVRKAVAELGYNPDAIARSLKTGTTRTLGLIISDIANPFFAAVIRGIEDVANERGYALMLCNTDERPEKERAYMQLLQSRRVDGMIMAPVGKREDYEDLGRAMPAPVVFIDRRVPAQADAVVVDNVRGAREAVGYLLGLGHRRIGVISGLPQISTSIERLAGYHQALHEAGLESDPLLLKVGYSRLEGGYRAALELLAMPDRPTAIFASNNLMVIGLMRAVAERGLACPAAVSVVGFDDFDWASVFQPRLTTVAQPTYEMGVKAAELLFARMGGERNRERQEIVLAPQLIIRDSCAVPPEGSDA